MPHNPKKLEEVPYSAEEFADLVETSAKLRRKNNCSMREAVYVVLRRQSRLHNRPEAWRRTNRAILAVLGRRGAVKTQKLAVAKKAAAKTEEDLHIPTHLEEEAKPFFAQKAITPKPKQETPDLPHMDNFLRKPTSMYRH